MLLAPLNRTNDPALKCCAHAFFAKKYACGSNFCEFSEKVILTCVFFRFFSVLGRFRAVCPDFVRYARISCGMPGFELFRAVCPEKVCVWF